MKKIIAFTLCLVCVFSLCACGKAPVDPEMADLLAAVDKAAGEEGEMAAVDASYVKGMLKLEVTDYGDFAVRINAFSKNIDEYGVFRGKDEAQVKLIKSAVETYIKMRQDTWITGYMPEELPKLESAKVWTQGSYVMYAILSEDAKAAVGTSFENCFKG
ncbi:MAG: DUF4358 domain-containing protein [Oscillospiraceae bacterium]